MKTPKIDLEKCIGCGTCISMCPQVFEFDGDKAKVIEKADFNKNEQCIKEASEACPNQAISL